MTNIQDPNMISMDRTGIGMHIKHKFVSVRKRAWGKN